MDKNYLLDIMVSVRKQDIDINEAVEMVCALEKMKYYFITYQAANRQGSISVWNQVIKGSPMKFIKYVQYVEENNSNTYYNFIVLNTCEISEDEFNEFDGHF